MSFKISIALGSGADRGLRKISRMTKMGYLINYRIAGNFCSRAAEAVWLVWHLPYHFFFVRMHCHTTFSYHIVQVYYCYIACLQPRPGSLFNIIIV